MKKQVQTSRGPLRAKGQAAVELAFILPILLLLLAAAIDFAATMYLLNRLTYATREGARVATETFSPLTDIQNVARVRTQTVLSNTGGITPSNVAISTNLIYRTVTNRSCPFLVVRADCGRPVFFSGILGFFGINLPANLSAQSTTLITSL